MGVVVGMAVSYSARYGVGMFVGNVETTPVLVLVVVAAFILGLVLYYNATKGYTGDE